MSDFIWVAGIRFPKTCGDYTLFKLDTQAAPKADGSPTFILRYKNNRNVFTLILYRVERDTKTGSPASVASQLGRSASTIAALANASGLTADPPVNVRVRSFYGNFIDRHNEDGAIVRDYTFIREFYGTFIKVRMTGGTLEEVLATIGLLCDRIDINTADIAIPAWKVDAETAPFGLRWGSKPSDLQSLGIKLLPVNESATVAVFGADDIQGDTGARTTFMEFNKTTGLRSVWNSYLIYDDPEGSRLRAKVQELKPIFLGAYTDWLGNMEFNSVDANFYRGLQANKQQFCSMTWRNLGSPVIVIATAANEPFLAEQPIGCITILYRADPAENSAASTETPGAGQDQASVVTPEEKKSGGIPRSLRKAAITIIVLASLIAIRAMFSSGTHPQALSAADHELMATMRRGAECLHLSDRKDGNVAVSAILRAGRDCPDAAQAGAGTR